MAKQGGGEPLRADAQRNRDALIEAAAAVFAASGVDVPMAEIAGRAGVGVGTVYRHFPKRSDLIVAVFRREVDACALEAAVLLNEHRPREALARWIDRYQSLIVTKRGLASVLHSGEPAYSSLPQYFEDRLVPPLRHLLDANGDDIQADVSAVDLLRAVALLCTPAASGDVDGTRRMIALLLDGLQVKACLERKPG